MADTYAADILERVAQLWADCEKAARAPFSAEVFVVEMRIRLENTVRELRRTLRASQASEGARPELNVECACGWAGVAAECPPNPSGIRTCPKCGASGGLRAIHSSAQAEGDAAAESGPEPGSSPTSSPTPSAVSSAKHHGECASCGEDIPEDAVRNWRPSTGEEWCMTCPDPSICEHIWGPPGADYCLHCDAPKPKGGDAASTSRTEAREGPKYSAAPSPAVASGEGALLPLSDCCGAVVYWNQEVQNFYCNKCRHGLGDQYYRVNIIKFLNRRPAPATAETREDQQPTDLTADELKALCCGDATDAEQWRASCQITRLTDEVEALRQQYSELSCRHTDVQRASDAAHRDCKTLAAEVQALKSDIAKYVDAAAEQATEVERLRRERDEARAASVSYQNEMHAEKSVSALAVKKALRHAAVAEARAQKVEEAARSHVETCRYTIDGTGTGDELARALSTPKGDGATGEQP